MRRLRSPLSSFCAPDKPTHLPQSAACFWSTRQNFQDRGYWTSATVPISLVWPFGRVKTSASPTSTNLSNKQRSPDWFNRRSIAPACPDTKWHPQLQIRTQFMHLGSTSCAAHSSMSALGQKRTCDATAHVRFTPNSDRESGLSQKCP